MYNLLIDNKDGKQQIIRISATGGYCDPSAVLWDERIDGAMPTITLGGMKRVSGSLVFDSAIMAANTVILLAEERVKKCAEMKVSYATSLASGYTTNSMLMDAYESNIARLKLGYDLAILKSEATMAVTDYNNTVNSAVAVADALTMIIDLGTNARVQYDNWTAKRAYIEDAARTIAEIQAVTW